MDLYEFDIFVSYPLILKTSIRISENIDPRISTHLASGDYIIEKYIDKSLPAVLEKSGKKLVNLTWFGKWSPCKSL